MPQDTPAPPTPSPTDDALDSARNRLDALHRRHRIDQRLIAGRVFDIESARLLVEDALEHQGDAEADDAAVDQAVEALRRRKPHLFTTPTPAHRAMGVRLDAEDTTAQSAATHATATGRLRDLLTYLRLRRSAGT
jgi:hypothetical protein